ncbi:MAG: hypothetical protein DU480_07905 [Nitrosomonas sp.]|uniref:hypothetical protein n=1 Tax=Nitrosomonas sp. TaxID=42353 RepID=UPI0032EDB40E
MTFYYGTHIRLKEVSFLLDRANSIAGNTENLTVYLDGDDYSQNNSIRADFHFPAFFWRKGDSIESVPYAIAALMNNPSVTHIIWLSKRLLDEEDIHIFWVYSHELRHFMQDQGAADIVKIKLFLNELHIQENYLGNGTQLEKPHELDAELFAKSTVKVAYGYKALSDYISLKCKQSNANSYFQRLEHLEKLLSIN